MLFRSDSRVVEEGVDQATIRSWSNQGYVTVVPPNLGGRRLARLAEGWLLLPYEPRLLVSRADGSTFEPPGCRAGDWVDLSLSSDRKVAWMLDVAGQIGRYADGACSVAADHGHGAVAALGDGYVTSEGEQLVWRGPDGAERWRADHPASAGPTDLAVSPDGRWVAAAGLDHAARVFDARTGALRGILAGDTERVSSLAFAGDRLVTGSWDGSVRLWDLASLDLPVNTLIERTKSTWNLDEAEVMRW